MCGVHNLQPEVPPENTAAMYEAALEYSERVKAKGWRLNPALHPHVNGQ
jgi:hypothetical protein